MKKTQNLFNTWGKITGKHYTDKQWLLSKWEVFEDMDWPDEKVDCMLQTIQDGLQLRPQDILLDLGCGGGWILDRIKPLVSDVIGVDFSFEMIHHARDTFPQEKLLCGKIGQLPLGDNICDKVLCYFVFINYETDEMVYASIRDIMRVLKPGGRALVGQLPDKDLSHLYDKAKETYLAHYLETHSEEKSLRDIHRIPQKLYDRKSLKIFLEQEDIFYQFRDSFNPFYRAGQPETIPWRFDLILEKQ